MAKGREMLIDAASGQRRPTVPQVPEFDSAACEWSVVHVEQHRIGALEIAPSSPVNHVFAVHLEGVNELEVADDGPFRLHRIFPGQVSFFPAGSVFASRTVDAGRFYTVSLTPQFVLNHALSPEAGTRPAFLPQRGISDSVIKALCDRIRDEVSAGHPKGRIYVEMLGQALAAHVTRHYANSAPAAPPTQGTLTAHQLRRALEFIREHLAEDLPLASISQASGLSPFHFARRFKQSTGLAPHQFLIHQRVDRARHLLVHSPSTLAEIAQKCGFCDQSHLTNHFRRIVGMTPRRYRDRIEV
jgi:AraC family transcriptional regulator